MEAAKTELYSGGYGAESSWNSVRETVRMEAGLSYDCRYADN